MQSTKKSDLRQRHPEKKLGLKAVIDNAFGGKEYGMGKILTPSRAAVPYIAPGCEDKNLLGATA